jgi:coiled-coil domain-containing protein 6
LKKIQALKKEKETLALNYEQEEECLTNDLSRKLNQVHLTFKWHFLMKFIL